MTTHDHVGPFRIVRVGTGFIKRGGVWVRPCFFQFHRTDPGGWSLYFGPLALCRFVDGALHFAAFKRLWKWRTT